MFCKIRLKHWPQFCTKLANGEVTKAMVKKKGLCTCCLSPRENFKSGNITSHKHLKLPVHQACQNYAPLVVTSNVPAASITELGTKVEIPVLSNPNPLGSASELIDIGLLEGPDRRTRKVGIIYDLGAPDTVLDFSLASYFHNVEEVEYTSKGVNIVRTFRTHIGDLKIIR